MSLQIRHPAFIARNVTFGALLNIFFGTLWLGNGLLALKTMQTLFLFAALAAVSTTFLVLFGRSELVLPVIVLSVGLYLLAPALILGLVQYYVAGALFCILPIGTVVLAPPGNSWLIIVGFIGGSIQFGLASINLRLAVSLRHRLRVERTLAAAAHGVGDAAEFNTTLHHSSLPV